MRSSIDHYSSLINKKQLGAVLDFLLVSLGPDRLLLLSERSSLGSGQFGSQVQGDETLLGVGLGHGSLLVVCHHSKDSAIVQMSNVTF